MAATTCETYERPVLKGYSKKDNVVYLYQPRCKCWACTYCATLNKQQWCARIADGIARYMDEGISGWNFVTITSHERLSTLSQTLYVWPKAWGKLSRRIRYHFPGIRYVLLPEQHEDGRLHIHAIASHGMRTRFLKDHGRSCGLGYKNKSDAIREAKQSVSYVTKYLSKSAVDAKWPSHFRRIRTSQRWPKLEQAEDFDQWDVKWQYLTTYPAEGLDYLATGLRDKTGVDVKVLR
jgi:hypothetical protein